MNIYAHKKQTRKESVCKFYCIKISKYGFSHLSILLVELPYFPLPVRYHQSRRIVNHKFCLTYNHSCAILDITDVRRSVLQSHFPLRRKKKKFQAVKEF